MGGRALARGGPHVYTYTSRAQASKAHYRSKRYDAHACVGKRHNLGVASWAGGAARTLHGTRGRSRRWLVRSAARLQWLTRLENQLHISRSTCGAWEGRLMISFSFFFLFLPRPARGESAPLHIAGRQGHRATTAGRAYTSCCVLCVSRCRPKQPIKSGWTL